MKIHDLANKSFESIDDIVVEIAEAITEVDEVVKNLATAETTVSELTETVNTLKAKNLELLAMIPVVNSVVEETEVVEPDYIREEDIYF